MLTLTDYIVLDRLYSGGTGPEAQTGDEVRLYLDTEAIPAFPEYIIGVIQNPIVRVNCETSTSYSIEYDEADLLGAVEFLRPQDVTNSEVTSALDELANAIEVETAARIADVNAEEAARIAALSNEAYDAGTWDGVTTVAPSKNVVRDKFVSVDAAIVSAQAAAIAASQPLDSDLTAIAAGTSATPLGDSTAQANRRAQIGAVGTALEITTALQGEAADPTRIGEEHMPASMTFDSIGVGEVPSAILPVGRLSRIGTELRIHDGTGDPLTGTPGGVPVSVPSGDPYRFTGFKRSLPYGTAGSTVKTIGTYYYDEIGRIKLPIADVVNGKFFHMHAWTRIITDVAGTSGVNRVMMIVPVAYWDVSPLSSALNAASPNLPRWNPLAASSLECEFIATRTSVITWSGGAFSLTQTGGFSSGRGYDETAAARYTDIVGHSVVSPIYPPEGQDIEFVIIAECTVAESKTVYADISLSVR